ncbi:MAG: nitrogen regulation protein NR(II) [Rhodospirillales bacterium]
MARRALKFVNRRPEGSPAADVVLSALPFAILIIDANNVVRYVNGAAEQMFEQGAALLTGQPLHELLMPDNPILSLLEQVRGQGTSVTEYDLAVAIPRHRLRSLTVDLSPIVESDGSMALSLREHSIARKIDQQLVHRSAARSVTGLAAMLAHEVKNPLSGIKGAAQLLHQTATDPDRELTRLICEETDRIVGLVNRVGMFAEDGPLEQEAINIHEVLERVRRIAEAGFARNVRFVESYDPSLPSVAGNRDLLIQAFLNLVKNASEAVPEEGGEVVLSTAYRHGVRLALPGSARRVDLPLVVTVQDNGPGIPDELSANLFDPFVTTKADGSGLGLSLVAKIVGDHGGVIEFDSEPRKTVFRVMLPVITTGAMAATRTE